MDFEVDENGLLRKPNIHDGYLLAIELPEKGIARLTLEGLSGGRFVIQMEGLDRLLCDGFAEGNIVREVRITTGREPDNGPLRRLLGELHPSVQEPYISKHELWVERTRQAIINGDVTFLEVVPSYGCEVFALCATISFLSVFALQRGGQRSN
jgi:hypothetical protein